MFKFFLIYLILNITVFHVNSQNAISTSVISKNTNNGTLVENYALLVQDIKWFFQRLTNFVTVVDGILPNITNASQNNSTNLSTRLHLLSGLKHLLAGVKELSITVQQSFDAAHVRQLQQLKQAEIYLQQAVVLLKDWFANLRVLLSEFLRLYNYYAPEVLLGKCVTQYLNDEYPEHAYYEYPLLLFNDVLDWVMARQASETQAETSHSTATDEVPIEQNEILYEEQEKKPYEIPNQRNGSELGNLVNQRENEIVNGNKTRAWQKCFQLYTTETIMRQLKLYFAEP